VGQADKGQVIAVDQVEEPVAFQRLTRLPITEDEANLAMDVAAMDVILHSLQKLPCRFIPSCGKPADI
jgi:hypothetical protein